MQSQSRIKTIEMQDKATYEIGKTVYQVSCVYSEKSETLNKILERLIKSEA